MISRPSQRSGEEELGASPTPGSAAAPSGATGASDAYAVFWLDLGGRVSRWSESSTNLFGHEAAAAGGMHFRELFAPEDRDSGRPEVALVRASDEGSWDDVGWKVTQCGRRLWAATSVTLVRTPNDVEVGYLVVSRDLSRLAGVPREEAVTSSASRLLSVGRVATEVAHEVSNILAAAKGFTGLLERHLPGGGAAHQVWRELLRTCERGEAVTGRLLRAGRPSGDELGAVDLERVIRDTEPLLRQVLPERILLVTSIDDDLPPVRARDSDLELVLLNLVVNARDAIDGRGTIVVAASRETGGSRGRGPGVELCVCDTGCGIPGEVREQVFDRFFTTKDCDTGTGLGLALVRDPVRGWDGAIELDSSVGGSAATRSGRDRESPSDLGDLHAKLVLVGTACSTLGGLVGGLLRRRGVDVLEADGLDAARRLLSEWGGAIDLVLLSDGFLDRAGPDPASVLADDAIASRIIVFPGDGPAAGPLDPVLAPGDRVLTGTFSAQRLVDAVAEVIAESDEAPRAAIN